MSNLAWIVAALVVAILLDGFLIWVWRGRGTGLRLSLGSIRNVGKLDRSVWLAAIAILGVLLILIGQLTDPPYTPLASGLRLFPGLTGLALFAGSGIFFLMTKNLPGERRPRARRKHPRRSFSILPILRLSQCC